MTRRTIVRFVEKIPTLARQITAKIPVLRKSEVPQEPETDRHSSTLFYFNASLPTDLHSRRFALITTGVFQGLDSRFAVFSTAWSFSMIFGVAGCLCLTTISTKLSARISSG